MAAGMGRFYKIQFFVVILPRLVLRSMFFEVRRQQDLCDLWPAFEEPSREEREADDSNYEEPQEDQVRLSIVPSSRRRSEFYVGIVEKRMHRPRQMRYLR